jgi:pilus assembly protein CpaB
MARMRVFLVLALALAAGGVLAYGTYTYVGDGTQAETVTMPTTKVVVAATDMTMGDEIEKSDVRIIEWPKNAVPQNVISDPNEVVGRSLLMPVIQNEPFLPMKLASKEGGSGLGVVIPPGLRAVSVRVNEVIGVAGYVVPGTRVDVLATVSPTQDQRDMTSKVILTDVQVLAAGTKIEQDVESKEPIPVNVVTLLVNPEEAERLTLAASEGKIQLALRNPLDKGTPTTRGVKPSGLLGNPPPIRSVSTRTAQGSSAQSAAAAPPAPTVEIIRGDKRAHEVVRGQE